MPFVPKNSQMTPRARELRNDMTPQERHLWYDFLSPHPVRFRRQRVIESFIADFYCSSALLVIELDGSQHFTPQGLAYDRERSAIFERYGIQVLRFTNHEVDTQFEAVCNQIDHVVKKRREALAQWGDPPQSPDGASSPHGGASESSKGSPIGGSSRVSG